jgi:uncharacterized protein with ParB-like and HNH nuclease domain
MFYSPISIREAVDKVNNTWYLPAIQRPYDWGDRDKKKDFIYKLFDSIIREYPIGTLIILETSRKIPYRPFIQDFDSEKLTKIVDKGHWSKKDKKLIYDGQQRLQSLFSCLKHTFHNEVLCYNLLFDLDSDKDPNGFKFVPKQGESESNFLRLNELYSCKRKQQAEFEDIVIERLKTSIKGISKKEILRAKINLKQLWKLFIDTDTKLLSYYPLQKDLEEKEVLDVFKRINTTGMALTKSEVLFSEIKNLQYDFEEQIWEANSRIKNLTTGFCYTPDRILQILNLLVKGTVRVDPERTESSELKKYVDVWSDLESPLTQFSFDFLYKYFKLTDESILGSKQSIVPLIVFFYYKWKINNYKFKDLSQKSIHSMKKFLIYSQLLYWDLQTIVDEANRIIRKGCEKDPLFDFPFQAIKNFVDYNTRKSVDIEADRDLDYSPQHWFVLKILTPDKAFSFTHKKGERLEPEIDHIFPRSPNLLQSTSKRYDKWVNTIWNMQLVKGEINGHKLNISPLVFFKKYPMYLCDYDCLPTKDLDSQLWLDKSAPEFIKSRRKKIIAYINSEYGTFIST